MSKRLSIIVPSYNVERYIEQCIRSCAAQDVPADDFEVIVVDDGSTDSTPRIARRVASDFSNVSVFTASHMGPGAARNIGFDAALGRYVWFVDADDWLERGCLDRILYSVEHGGLDALQIGFYTFVNETRIPCAPKFRKTTSVMHGHRYVIPGVFDGSSWATIFRREIAEANRIRFDEDLMLGEDQLFFLSIFAFAAKVKRLDLIAYNYRIIGSSLTHSGIDEEVYKSASHLKCFRFRPIFPDYCHFMVVDSLLNLFGYARDTSRLHLEIEKYGAPLRSHFLCRRKQIKAFLYRRFGKSFIACLASLQRLRTTVRSG